MAIRSLDDLQGLLGAESEAVIELQQLFKLADGYGCVLLRISGKTLLF